MKLNIEDVINGTVTEAKRTVKLYVYGGLVVLGLVITTLLLVIGKVLVG